MKINKIFKINPFFIAFFVFFIIKFEILFSLWYFLATLIHEYGHYFCAKKCGYKPRKFSLSPYGIAFSVEENLESFDEFLIALFGPLANILSSLIMLAIWWIFPAFYNVSYEFVWISIVMAGINLIPAYPLDGGRIFKGLFFKLSSKTTGLILKIVNGLLILALITMFFVLIKTPNFSLLIFAVFLGIGYFDFGREQEYEKYSVFTKKLKNFSNVKFVYVKEDTKLLNLVNATASNSYIIFVIEKKGKVKILTENMLKSLVEKDNVSDLIGDIIFEPRKYLG